MLSAPRALCQCMTLGRVVHLNRPSHLPHLQREITMQMFAHPSFMTELRSHLTVKQQLTKKCPHCRTAAVPVPEQPELSVPATLRGQGRGEEDKENTSICGNQLLPGVGQAPELWKAVAQWGAEDKHYSVRQDEQVAFTVLDLFSIIRYNLTSLIEFKSSS